MAWKGVGKGGKTFLQQAIQGVVVDALGLGSYGKAPGKGAKSAGKGKSAAGKAADQKDEATKKLARTCTWADCRAAKSRATTWGFGNCCFDCRRPLSTKPAVENMVDWAFQAALAESRAAATQGAHGDQDKAKGKAQGKGQNKTAQDAKTQAAAKPADLADL